MFIMENQNVCFYFLFCVACQPQFSSPYSGNQVTGVLGSSVNFTWAFSGGTLLRAQWGTKKDGANILEDVLVSIDKHMSVTTIQTLPYSGRVSGVWDGNSPGQATFTLNSIQKADERLYICKLEPDSLVAVAVYDTVDFLVLGK